MNPTFSLRSLARFVVNLIKLRIPLVVGALAAFLLTQAGAASVTTAGSLTMEVVTAYNLVIDSNVETPASYSPRAAHFGVKVTNTGATLLTDIYVKFGNLTNAGTGAGTPGTYPVTTVAQGAGWGYWGDFSFTHQGGASDATRYIASLAAGDSVMVYWLVSYPLKDANGQTVAGATNLTTDDLRLDYDVWVQATEGLNTRRVYDERHAYCRNEISAMANKIWPNTDSKVPDQYLAAIQSLLGWRPGSVPRIPGAMMTEGIWYDLGNVGAGFDNNGDFVPDRNAWMQPVGDPSLYDATALRLVKAYGIVIVKLNDGTEQLMPFEDQLYFENVPANNTGAVGLVFYEFMPLRGGATGTLTPYQEVASGYNNEKFNGDYGTSFSIGTAPTPTVSIDKSGPATVASSGEITYTMLVTNTSSTTAFGSPELGFPAAVSDAIPANCTYVLNSTGVSGLQNGNTVQVRYSTDGGVTWTTTQPASGVTHLQWWFANAMQPGESATVTFKVTAPASGTHVINTAGFGLATLTPQVTDSVTTHLTGVRTISGTVFADTGSGAFFGNGVLDSGETTGIGSIGVSLYVDVNNDGLLDSGDVFRSSIDSTAGTGAFSFTGLPPAKYIVVVNSTDSNLPVGYSLTSSVNLAADVTSADATGKNFGFAPALAVDKTLIGTSPVYEGDYVIYDIDVTNRRSGSGGGSSSQTRVTWANSISTGAHTGSQFLNAANAAGAGRSEGGTLYATAPLAGNEEYVVCTGWNIATPPTGTITKVEILLDSNSITDVGSSTVELDVVTVSTGNTARTAGSTITQNISSLTNGVNAFDVTSWRTWNWSDFLGGTYGVDITAKKSANPTGKFHLYATGLRITSTVTGTANADNTLSPVPLTDTYDADLMQFVSANPVQASVTVTGTAPNKVGTITWTDVGPIAPGVSKDVSVRFLALEPTNNTQQTGVRNTATVNQATYQNGIDAGDDDGFADVTLEPTGSIGDFVWRDSDGGGDQDATEPGIPNVTVFVDSDNDSTLDWADSNGNGTWDTGEGERWVATDSTGYYLFSGLRTNGAYNVRVLASTLPGGAGTCTKDRDVTANGQTSVTLTSLESILDADFGYQPTNELITGTIWHDLNTNGASTPGAGEPWLTGVTVTLYNSSGVSQGTTTTDANGLFTFSGDYAAGSYYVLVTPTTGDMTGGGWTQSYDTSGLATLNRVDFSLVTGGSAQADFSYYKGLHSIGDTVFYDWDKDGTQDSGEQGIPNVAVSLYNSSMVLLESVVTNSSGIYSFTNRSDAGYFVVVNNATVPSGFTQTKDPDQVGVCTTCDAKASVTLAGANINTIDFGYAPTGTSSIGDFVYWDANDNGTQDTGETGIGGVTMQLWSDPNGDGNLADGTLLTTTTTSTGGATPLGSYTFPYLTSGQYYAVKVVPLGSMTTQTADPDRDGEGRASTVPDLPGFDNTDSKILLGSGSYTGADFGYLPSGVIGDRVWLDQDGDHVQDSGEAGIAGVTVFLDGGNGTLEWTDSVGGNGVWDAGEGEQWTTTDNDGYYSFSNLANGTYAVTLTGTPLTGKVVTYDADGTGTPNKTSVTLSGGAVTVPSGTGSLDIDFGLKLNGSYSIAGAVCIHDTRTLGICDDIDNFSDDGADLDVGTNDETELGGLTVYLYTSGGSYLGLTTTADDGTYSFVGLPAGDYRVVLDSTPAPLNLATLNIPSSLPVGVTSITPNPGATGPGSVVSAVTISTANVTHVDYAFSSAVNYDFGDLPSSYEATTWANDGARHIIPTSGTLVYLGSVQPDAEANGQPTANATGDDLGGGASPDDEGGVTPHRISAWADGAASNATNGTTGGWVQVTVPNGVTGYLVGWIDWNHNNSLIDTITGTSEMIISQPITGTGSPQTIAFAIPTGTVISSTDESWLARFRIFTEAPAFPLFAYKGEATNGEVEDYQFQHTVGSSISDFVWSDVDGDGIQDAGEFGLGGVTVTLSGGPTSAPPQTTSDGTQDVDGDGVIDPPGFYRFSGLAAGTYTVTVTQPVSGYVGFTQQNVGGDTLDSDANSSGVVTAVVLGSSTQDTTTDIGLIPSRAKISGTVFYDANDDNLFGGDTSIATVVVQLWTDPNGDGNPADGVQVAETFTNGSGAYEFANVPSGKYVVIEIDPIGATSDLDTDNPTPPTTASDNRIRVNLAGSDSTGNNFLDDGTITAYLVSGTVYDDVNHDFVFNGSDTTTLAAVTVKLYADANNNGTVDADEVLVYSTQTNGSGLYTFSNVLPGNYLVVETDLTTPRYSSVTDIDGNSNGKSVIDVTVTSGNSTGNNFLDFLQACPDVWADWRTKWDLVMDLADLDLTDNPDGDRYNNLLEYAFCMPPNSGVKKPFCLEPSLTVSGGIDGVFRRTAGGTTDVVYTLERTAALGNPTDWTTLTPITLNSLNTTVTINADGTETVRIVDLETKTTLTGGEGFVRMRATIGANSATTEVLGWTETTLNQTCSTFNNPFLRCATFTGTVTSVSDQNIVFSGENFVTGQPSGNLLESGEKYYLEVTSGDNEGHRFDVVSAGGTNLVVANDTDLHAPTDPAMFNTQTGPPPTNLAGDTVVLRRHWQLGVQFPVSTAAATGFVADTTAPPNNAPDADQVQLYTDGAWVTYYVYDADGAGGAAAYWRQLGDSDYEDVDDDKAATVLPPGQGMFVSRPNPSIQMLSYGEVRENQFIRPLQAGATPAKHNNLVGGGFPYDQSARGTGSRQMNLTPTLVNGFFGSRDFKTADSFFIWKGDTNGITAGYDSYFLLSAASPVTNKWVKVGDATIADQGNDDPLASPTPRPFKFLSDRSVFIRVASPLPLYTIPCPWTNPAP
jgi:hypothetical protein